MWSVGWKSELFFSYKDCIYGYISYIVTKVLFYDYSWQAQTHCRCKKLLVNIIIQNQALINLIQKFLYNAFSLLTKCRGVVNSNDKLSIAQVNYYCKTCLILLMLHPYLPLTLMSIIYVYSLQEVLINRCEKWEKLVNTMYIWYEF